LVKKIQIKNNGTSLKNLQKELAQIEEKMHTLETERNLLHISMSTSLNSAELVIKGKLLKQIEKDLSTLEARWLELTDYLESTTEKG